MRPHRVVALGVLAAALAATLAAGMPPRTVNWTDDFNDGDMLGWRPFDPKKWRVVNGAAEMTPLKGANWWGGSYARAGVRAVNGVVEVDATPMRKGLLGWASAGLLVKDMPGQGTVRVVFGPFGRIVLITRESGDTTRTAIGSISLEPGRTYKLRAEVKGANLSVFLDDAAVARARIPFAGAPGHVGLYCESPARFDNFRVTGVVRKPGEPDLVPRGRPNLVLEHAEWAPDRPLPFEAVSIHGSIRVFCRNNGDGSAELDSATLDGVPLAKAGSVVYYELRPHRIEPGKVGELLVRLRSLPAGAVEALLENPDARPRARLTLTPTRGPALRVPLRLTGRGAPLQVNLAAFSDDLRSVTLFLQNNRAALDGQPSEFEIQSIGVDGAPVTQFARFGSRRVGRDVVPVEIALPGPLPAGRHVPIIVRARGGAVAAHCVRAIPTRVVLAAVTMGRHVRKDVVKDLYNHCFNSLSAQSETLRQAKKLGMWQAAFGAYLKHLAYIDRPDYPPIVTCWSDEVDKRTPEIEAVLFHRMMRYYWLAGRPAPFTFANIISPWSVNGFNFMPLFDGVCHAYGYSDGSYGRDFGRQSSTKWREYRRSRKPFHPYLRNAEIPVPIDPKKKKVLPLIWWRRCTSPVEERSTYYGLLMHGAKGFHHWGYWAYYLPRGFYHMPRTQPGLRIGMGALAGNRAGEYVIPDHIVRMLADVYGEIGRLNAEVRTVAPLLRNSDVSYLAKVVECVPAKDPTGKPAAAAAALVSGLDSVIVVVLSHNVTRNRFNKPKALAFHEPVSAKVAVRIPAWLKPKRVVHISCKGVTDYPSRRENGRIILNFPKLEVGEMVVITSSDAKVAEMRRINADMRARLAAAEKQVPQPVEPPKLKRIRKDTSPRVVYISDLTPTSVSQWWGRPQRDHNLFKEPLTVGSLRFDKGVATHAFSALLYRLDGRFKRFRSFVGVDRSSLIGTVQFWVYLDGRPVWTSGLLKGGQEPREVNIPIVGAKRLLLLVTDGGDGKHCDHPDWADAKLIR